MGFDTSTAENFYTTEVVTEEVTFETTSSSFASFEVTETDDQVFLITNTQVDNSTSLPYNNATLYYERHFWALGLVIIPVLTLFGNLLVIVSVIKIRSLHTAINCLILALAVADCMVAVFVMPFAVYIEVSGKNNFFPGGKADTAKIMLYMSAK